MHRIAFWKLQSIGNDFPLVHADAVAVLGAETGASADFLLASLAVQITDRRFGVGGDGLLALGIEAGDLRLRMFNNDGTEDFCGNGMRVAIWHAHLLGWISDSGNLRHLDMIVPYTIRDGLVSTIIGTATYDPSAIPHTGFGEIFNQNVWSGMDGGMPLSFTGSVLSTGTAHTIIPTYSLPDDDSFRSVSAKIETAPQYPERTSVIWRQELEPMKLKLRIWERGVGETWGCGTGSAAAAADYLRQKGKGGKIEVQSAGGTVFVSMERWDAPITVEGSAEQVYSGEYLFSL